MPQDSSCEWKSESQFIRQDAKRETILSASIVCKNIKSYVPCSFHMTLVLLDHVLDLVLGFYPIPDPIPRFEKKIDWVLGLVLDIGEYWVKYWEKTQYLSNTRTQYQTNTQYLFWTPLVKGIQTTTGTQIEFLKKNNSGKISNRCLQILHPWLVIMYIWKLLKWL